MDIGASIRAIRKQRKITISQLCEGTGLSKGFISNVENNKTSPSIATLESIATFLNVPLPYLLLKNEQRMHVVRKDERQQTTAGSDNLKVEHLSAKGGLRMMICEMPPGATTGTNMHAGEECHFVLKGKIVAEQAEDMEVLEAGDSFSWNASVPHKVTNTGDESALVLISVYKDISFEDIQ
ncbi:helix-turn-helix domain-containing protein [Paenibacillus assamensis]|uniref:helix-turn-helix domain-containing protein n=1 Tax=Paenibacillus assamensis TaxID=311244 RepID=UPI00041F0CC9|nr:cupin domain-containing protein [Paenibacillus assamensis]